jgi:hypothetical protein
MEVNQWVFSSFGQLILQLCPQASKVGNQGGAAGAINGDKMQGLVFGT